MTPNKISRVVQTWILLHYIFENQLRPFSSLFFNSMHYNDVEHDKIGLLYAIWMVSWQIVETERTKSWKGFRMEVIWFQLSIFRLQSDFNTSLVLRILKCKQVFLSLFFPPQQKNGPPHPTSLSHNPINCISTPKGSSQIGLIGPYYAKQAQCNRNSIPRCADE